jgi:hypothetical protein
MNQVFPFLWAAALVASASVCFAQGPAAPSVVPASEQLALLVPARLQYYNLQAHGVKSYACDVDFDWGAFFKAVSGKTPNPADPTQVYLNSSHLHFVSDLDGPYQLAWGKGNGMPDGKESAIQAMHDTMQQMIVGFLQAWTPSLNGNLYPVEVQSMKRTATGYELRQVTPQRTMIEQVNSSMLLESIDEQANGTENKMDVTFSGSPGARLLTSVGGDYRQSPGGSAISILMKTAFQTVDGVQIPASLTASVPGIAAFDFNFKGCTVKKVVIPKAAD